MDWLEARQALQSIARNPRFSVVAILMLAAGTGSATTVFSLRPIPATCARAAVTLLTVALGASYAPAWRAGIAEPIEQLRV
jgi:hypothetical protein